MLHDLHPRSKSGIFSVLREGPFHIYTFGIVRPIQHFDVSARARLPGVLYNVRSRGRNKPAVWGIESTCKSVNQH
jgi:hypothetical protein